MGWLRMKNKAFTLAEALIVIVIMGIVAALTIPALVGTYMRKACATQLRRTVGEITTATKTIIAEEKADETVDPNNVDMVGDQTGFYYTKAGSSTSDATQGARYFLENFFKHNLTERADTIANTYKNSAGTEIGTIPPAYTDCVQTPGSATICMHYDAASDFQRLFVDVNGKQKPNTAGVDLFVMQITATGTVEDINRNHQCGQGGDVATAASGCFARVVSNGWRIE